MKKNSPMGLSIPNELIQRIDSERGDVSRSRFLLRLIQRAYLLQEKENGGSFRS